MEKATPFRRDTKEETLKKCHRAIRDADPILEMMESEAFKVVSLDMRQVMNSYMEKAHKGGPISGMKNLARARGIEEWFLYLKSQEEIRKIALEKISEIEGGE